MSAGFDVEVEQSDRQRKLNALDSKVREQLQRVRKIDAELDHLVTRLRRYQLTERELEKLILEMTQVAELLEVALDHCGKVSNSR